MPGTGTRVGEVVGDTVGLWVPKIGGCVGTFVGLVDPTGDGTNVATVGANVTTVGVDVAAVGVVDGTDVAPTGEGANVAAVGTKVDPVGADVV